jgi:hypothetical protein
MRCYVSTSFPLEKLFLVWNERKGLFWDFKAFWILLMCQRAHSAF